MQQDFQAISSMLQNLVRTTPPAWMNCAVWCLELRVPDEIVAHRYVFKTVEGAAERCGCNAPILDELSWSSCTRTPLIFVFHAALLVPPP